MNEDSKTEDEDQANPMDPERLEKLRELLDGDDRKRCPSTEDDWLRELLADRDHWTRIAEDATVEIARGAVVIAENVATARELIELRGRAVETRVVTRTPGAVLALVRARELTPEQADALKKALGVELLVHWREGRTPEETLLVLDEDRMRREGWVRA